MPDAVSILLDNTYLSLQSSDQQTWKHQDVIVELKSNSSEVSVFIQSPTLPLKEVQIQAGNMQHQKMQLL